MEKEVLQKIVKNIQMAHDELVPKGSTLAWCSMEDNLSWSDLLALGKEHLECLGVEVPGEQILDNSEGDINE